MTEQDSLIQLIQCPKITIDESCPPLRRTLLKDPYFRVGGIELEQVEEMEFRWVEAGFGDEQADLVNDWYEAGVFRPESAAKLTELGISPEQVSTKFEICDYQRTLGYAYANGDISIKEVMEQIQS